MVSSFFVENLQAEGSDVNSVFAAEHQVLVVGLTVWVSSTPGFPKQTKCQSLDQVHHVLAVVKKNTMVFINCDNYGN